MPTRYDVTRYTAKTRDGRSKSRRFSIARVREDGTRVSWDMSATVLRALGDQIQDALDLHEQEMNANAGKNRVYADTERGNFLRSDTSG